MPKFAYSAIDATGAEIEGTTKADTIGTARSMLVDKNLFPIKIEESRGMFSFELTKEKAKKKNLMNFTRQLAVFVKAGIPITEALTHGKGVCQDFAHVMIGCARAMKIPARYVSGLVHPDARRFRGYTQTHAWCELLFPSAGWIGFDPTNHCIVGPNFVKVAVGRDYRDVPPNKGVYRGSAYETIDVQVKSIELKMIPPELAAERVLPLSVEVFPGGKTAHRELVTLQQEHQQQQ